MIKIKNEVIREQKNFWNNCLFHPTDAVEDPWGKKILDRMAKDGSINTVRLYAMFEDIVYEDEDGELAYDFRISDVRLDYMLEKGYNLLLACGMMPECIALNKRSLMSNSKNKTRYKGKLINTSIPKDYKLWEGVCYNYAKHLIDRYGIEVVSKWRFQCFNEPDGPDFFWSDVPRENVEKRAAEYCKLYTAFAKGMTRASDKLNIGGPALSTNHEFLKIFLKYMKDTGIKIDFISVHNYANMWYEKIVKEGKKFSADEWADKLEEYIDNVKEFGFDNIPFVIDEWGMSGGGFLNIEECPPFIARENEVFSAYYAKILYRILEKGWDVANLMICLSGQHEMVTDFSGFRNFFTLNFIKKPIYNTYVLASKLHESLLAKVCENENLYVIPTKSGDKYSVLVSYSSEYFEEDLPEMNEKIVFDTDIKGKKVTVYCIDKDTTNPYRLYQKMGEPEMDEETINALRVEGNIKPIKEFKVEGDIELKLTANCVYLIEVE